MSAHRFTLNSKQGKYTCPQCGQNRRFSRYFDTYNEYAFPDNVGRCDRVNSCGYHYPPKQFFEDNPDERKAIFDTRHEFNNNYKPVNQYAYDEELEKFYTDYEFLYDEVRQRESFDCFGWDILRSSLAEYENNSFTNALALIFSKEHIKNVIDRYYLGTTKDGGVVFWQIDASERVRYGKRMYYLANLHRDKTKNPIGAHYLIGKKNLGYRQCFFGEHLLKLPENKNKAVAIVESEKSACICSEVLQDYVWLATGGKSGIKWKNKSVWDCLQGRKVILCPDVDAHNKWTENARLFQSFGIDVQIFSELTKVASGTQYDIADYIIKDLMQRNLQNIGG